MEFLLQPFQQPKWLEEVVNEGWSGEADGQTERDDGRTYVATRALPGGQGAFAYVAVTLAEQEPRWIGGGEG